MLSYFRPITPLKSGGEPWTISIDKVVLDYKIAPRALDELIDFLQKAEFSYGCTVKHWESFKIGRYRYNFTVELRDHSSFWLGVGLTQEKVHWGRVRLEFNPNKVANHAVFLAVLACLNYGRKGGFCEVKRYDLAIDIPAPRSEVFLVKDNRAYSEIRHSAENLTQYLGSKSSTVGRCKLYNKQIEAKLDYPLTRLELTLGNPMQQPYRDIPFPKVYFISNIQTNLDERVKLTDTDRFILNSLLQGCGQLSQLGRKTRQKMETILAGYITPVGISLDVYNTVRNQLSDFFRFPQNDFGDGELDYDVRMLPPEHWDNHRLPDIQDSTDFIEVENKLNVFDDNTVSSDGQAHTMEYA